MNDLPLDARFHPRLPTYLVVAPAIVLALTVVGIPVLLLWIPLGGMWARRFVERLTCRLTEDTVEIGKGLLFRNESTIPLDRIQDIALREGPLQRYLGISSLRFETAGGAGAAQSGNLDIPGIRNAREFRAAVLAQRNRLRRLRAGGRDEVTSELDQPTAAVPLAAGAPAEDRHLEVLLEIRDTLKRLEGRGGGSTASGEA
jgi:putative membrane protein